MKVRYATANSRLQFEFEAASTKEAVEFLAVIQELFEETTCQQCGSEHVKFDVRNYDGNTYYKLRCDDCYATLDFGQRRDGVNLFLKRKDADGHWMPNRGWYRYHESNQPRSEDHETPPRPSKSSPAPRTENAQPKEKKSTRSKTATTEAAPF
jgi:hypothetical protein